MALVQPLSNYLHKLASTFYELNFCEIKITENSTVYHSEKLYCRVIFNIFTLKILFDFSVVNESVEFYTTNIMPQLVLLYLMLLNSINTTCHCFEDF